MTRAEHQAVIWWAGSRDSKDSPLGRLLFAGGEDGAVSPVGNAPSSDEQVAERLAALGGGISVERIGPVADGAWQSSSAPPPELEADSFDRTLDEAWRRASYSSISQASHEQAVASEPEQDVMHDEDVVGAVAADTPSGPSDAPWQALPLLLSEMAAGTRVGTLVHSVMEVVDFAAPDLEGELWAALKSELSWQHLDLGDPAMVVTGLLTAIECPLGPSVGDVRLRDVARSDRLDEMSFELPLAGGDRPSGALSVIDIAGVLGATLAPGDPLSGYVTRLADPALDADLRGYLTGSLDLVLRLPGERFVVVDYKTNRLAPPDETVTAWHYRPAALTAQMEAAHYPLQALLYTVALHRYLRWRVRGYDPDSHLGGVLYLFLRGMSNPSFPALDGQPCGVWSWRAPRRR